MSDEAVAAAAPAINYKDSEKVQTQQMNFR
jgi:hypothetical protein